jgi:superfamily II DNA helicase RecQ
MKDQVNALVDRGVKAASLDSTLMPGQLTFVKDEVLSGSIKILYVAPERCELVALMIANSLNNSD